MRRTLAVGMLAAALTLLAVALQAEEHDEMDRDEIELRKNAQLLKMSVAVLDWCNERTGAFFLPKSSMPLCLMNGVAYVGFLASHQGALKAGPRYNEEWWLELRSKWSLFKQHPHLFDFDLGAGEQETLIEAEVGVAWYIREVVDEELTRIFECPTDLVLNNPAQIPVVLIGSGGAVCEAGL